MDGWIIGFIIGGAVVVVVVVLLLTLILLARRIVRKAEAILTALQAAQRNTAGLVALQQTNQHAGRINSGAIAAREAVERGA